LTRRAATAIEWATSQPPHVNVNRIELMPTGQSFAPFQIYRTVGGEPYTSDFPLTADGAGLCAA